MGADLGPVSRCELVNASEVSQARGDGAKDSMSCSE